MYLRLHTIPLQNILEKFEFFPIKCRVQRSLEIFKKNLDQRQAANQLACQWKQKVLISLVIVNYIYFH